MRPTAQGKRPRDAVQMKTTPHEILEQLEAAAERGDQDARCFLQGFKPWALRQTTPAVGVPAEEKDGVSRPS